MYSYIIYIMVSFENMIKKYEMCEKMNEKMLEIFNKYSLEDEIYNLEEEVKVLIKSVMKKMAIGHIKKYGYIDNNKYFHYLILEILSYLGIDMGILLDMDRDERREYKKKFDTLIKESNKKLNINNIKNKIANI